MKHRIRSAAPFESTARRTYLEIKPDAWIEVNIHDIGTPACDRAIRALVRAVEPSLDVFRVIGDRAFASYDWRDEAAVEIGPA